MLALRSDLKFGIAMAGLELDDVVDAWRRTFDSIPEWLEFRDNLIGASEVAAALGLSRYESKYGLWSRKVGISPPTAENRPMRRGNALEDFVASEWALENPTVKIINPAPPGKKTIFVAPHSPRMGVTPDRFIVASEGPYAGKVGTLQIKTSNSYGEWTNGTLPEEYVIQCHSEMAVLGTSYCILAVYILGYDQIMWFVIERDEDTITLIREEVIELWMQIEDGIAALEDGREPTNHPDYDASESTMAAIKARYASESRTDVELRLDRIADEAEQKEIATLEERYIVAHRAKADAIAEEEAVKQSLMLVMKDASRAYLPLGSKVTWKMKTVRAHVRKENTYREFKITVPGEN